MKPSAPALALVLATGLVVLAGPAAADQAAALPMPGVPVPAPQRFEATLESSLAVGDLAMTGTVLLSIAEDQLSFSLTGLCIENYRAATATDVHVEVWGSKSVPSVNNVPAHHVGGTFYIGTVSGYSTRCQNSGTLPATPPPPDVYWVSLALYEGSGPSRVLHAIHTFSPQIDSGGPIYSDGGTLYFEKPVNAYITNGGGNASLQIGRIRNTSGTPTRPLRIGLRASVDPPRFGQTLPGWTFMSKEYGPLASYSSLTNVDTGSLATVPPQAGTYWITAFLWQLGSDGTTWYYVCIYTFPTRYTFTSSPTPAPVADFSFSPASPQAGQSVSFTDVSSGSPTSWSWSFGDGGTATARNPSHVFAAAGSYAVTLTATNAGGSNARTKTVVVTAPPPTVPVITYFGANPPAVVAGQLTTLTWTSTGGTTAAIDQGVGPVPTSGSRSLAPVVGVPYTLTVTGPGGTATARVTVSSVPSAWAGTWILPSSARAPGANAFWTTDLTVTNPGAEPATLLLKFLGHQGTGPSGPERTYTLPARATFTWPDVLSSVFGRQTDWGPILIRSNVTTLSAQGQTFTASPTGGSYGQSVPALGPSEAVGATPRVLSGVRQDSSFRTNVVLANLRESEAVVTLQALLADGTTATTRTVPVGPLGFVQLNLASDLGLASFSGGSILVSSATPGAQVAAYASVIDAATADPRTILAR